MKNQKTKIEMFTEIQKVLTDKEMIDFLEKQKDLIRNKNSKKGLTATQKQNIEYKDIILNALTDTMQIKDLQATNETINGLSNQKVSALLKQLVDEKKVQRIMDNRDTYFAKV